MEELEEKHEGALAAGEDRVREVLGSLHAVEKAFVQYKNRCVLPERLACVWWRFARYLSSRVERLCAWSRVR